MGWADWISTQARTDEVGKYRFLYLQPDEYDILVRTPEQGVALVSGQVVGHGRHELDIKLDAGVAFRATVADANSGQPRRMCD